MKNLTPTIKTLLVGVILLGALYYLGSQWYEHKRQQSILESEILYQEAIDTYNEFQKKFRAPEEK